MTDVLPIEELQRSSKKTLLTGWFSFVDGEATAGDLLALETVRTRLADAGIAHDIAFSPRFRPGELSLEEADPGSYGHVVFVCGPLHGEQITGLHRKFSQCVRLAVGTSVVDREDPAFLGFHRVAARDGDGVAPETPDLAAGAPEPAPVPVVGVILTAGQGEYGERRRHETVARSLTSWLKEKDCACVPLDTRLDAHDWQHCATAGQFLSAVARTDLVVTDRLHGLVLALRAGVPALAADPVLGGAKVSAQARVCRWPALVAAETLDQGRDGVPVGGPFPAELDHWWAWCLGPGRSLARERRTAFTQRRRGTEGGTADGAGTG